MRANTFLILLCIAASFWAWQQNPTFAQQNLVFSYSNLLHRRIWTLVTALFVHANLLHLFGNMKEENPQVSIVVSSGYIDPSSKAKMYKAGIRNFVDKPYTPEAVVEILDAVIQQNRTLELASVARSTSAEH